MRRRLMGFGAGVVALAVLVVVLVVRLTGPDDGPRVDAADTGSVLHQAMAHAMSTGQRFLWTDWSGVREKLGDADLSISSPVAELRGLLGRGYRTDLSSSSALPTSAAVMQEHYGFSPASLDWELFTQSPKAAVEMFGLGADADIDAIETALKAIGYTPPDSPDGIWRGNLDDIKRIGDVTPEITFLSIDASRGVILGSDTDTGLALGLAAYHEDSPSAAGLDDVVDAVGVPLSATIYSSDEACSALAMSTADASDQAAATDLIARAGHVDPLTGFAMAYEPTGPALVAMSFATDDQARTNATTRATLASGPAFGQGGDFSDRFTLGQVAASGRVVTMQLDPVPGSFIESDLSTGPLVFATC